MHSLNHNKSYYVIYFGKKPAFDLKMISAPFNQTVVWSSFPISKSISRTAYSSTGCRSINYTNCDCVTMAVIVANAPLNKNHPQELVAGFHRITTN